MEQGESQAQRLCDLVRMLLTRSWTHKSQLPVAALWGSAASQIHIKTCEMDKWLQLEQLPSASPGCPAQVEICHDGVFPAKIQASPYSFFFFFLLCACKTCQRLRFLSAKEMSQGLSKVSFPFIFVFCCQFSSCIS